MCLTLPVTESGAEPSCRLTIHYVHEELPLSGVAFRLYRVAELDDDTYEQMWAQAVAYNESRSGTTNPYLLNEEQKKTYHQLLNLDGNGVMGYIEIPSLSVSLPVGGQGTHCVLSGHRGLPSAKLFTDLDDLRVGDTFMLRSRENKL